MLLVTGTSGVGKTFTIGAAMHLDRSLVRLSGSRILEEIGRPITALTIQGALQNQARIVDYLSSSPVVNRRGVLFDGHAALETDEGLLLIPFHTVDKMRLTGVALIEANPEDVSLRRLAKARDATVPIVKRLQELERTHSLDIANRLAIPHAIIPSGDADALLLFLRSLKRPGLADSR